MSDMSKEKVMRVGPGSEKDLAKFCLENQMNVK